MDTALAAAPWFGLTLAIFLVVYLVRRYRPAWWTALDSITPDGAAGGVLQALPATLLGALWGVAESHQGDYSKAWKGALAGAVAPLVHHALKASPLAYQGAVKAISTGALLLFFTGCGSLPQAAVPALSMVDAIGRGVAHAVGWCDARGIEPVSVESARQALVEKDYGTALDLAARMISNARAKGDPIPEQVEVELRLAEGALAAQAIQDGMRALSGGPSK